MVRSMVRLSGQQPWQIPRRILASISSLRRFSSSSRGVGPTADGAAVPLMPGPCLTPGTRSAPVLPVVSGPTAPPVLPSLPGGGMGAPVLVGAEPGEAGASGPEGAVVDGLAPPDEAPPPEELPDCARAGPTARLVAINATGKVR